MSGKQSGVVKNFKKTIEMLDANRPKIEKIDWAIMNKILEDVDFSKCKNTMAAMNLFYEHLWYKIIFAYEEECHIKNREMGRVILEADMWKRRAEKYQKQIDSIRESLQEEGEGCIKKIRALLLCEGSSSDQRNS